MPYPVISAAGNSRDLGFMHGKQCAEQIREFLAFAMRLFCAAASREKNEILKAARRYIPSLERFCPHLAGELRGVAEGSGLTFEEILFLHVRTELLPHTKIGCSAFAVAPGSAKAGIMLAGQNWDNVPFYADKMIILKLEPSGKPGIMMVTFPGVIGYIGINSAGVSVWDNQLMCGGWTAGLPHYFIKRMILEQRTVGDVTAMLKAVNPASSENFIVTDGEGNSASFECTPHGIGVLKPRNGILYHTNHFLSPELREREEYIAELPDTVDRYRRLSELFERWHGNLSPETIMTILADHHNFPRSLCRHSDHSPQSMATCSSVIAEPGRGRMYVASGNPCVCPYTVFELDSEKT